MVCLQAGIGATNDVVDAPRDAGHKPGKPIPAGLVSARGARALAAVAFAAGLGLSAPSGPATLGLAVVVIVVGLLYDLRLKGTALSWLPFAVGIPILPVFGWLGAAGSLPAAFAVLVPAAVAAGAGLSIANALADLERDRAAGAGSIAVALGLEPAWRAQALLIGTVAVAAVASAAQLGAPGEWVVLVGLCASLPLTGIWLGRSRDTGRRERAWEIEAMGIALVGISWIAALLDSAAFRTAGP